VGGDTAGADGIAGGTAVVGIADGDGSDLKLPVDFKRYYFPRNFAASSMQPPSRASSIATGLKRP